MCPNCGIEEEHMKSIRRKEIVMGKNMGSGWGDHDLTISGRRTNNGKAHDRCRLLRRLTACFIVRLPITYGDTQAAPH